MLAALRRRCSRRRARRNYSPELLEPRLLLTNVAPQVSAWVTTENGMSVVEGNVTDESIEDVEVEISGVGTGTVTPDATGAFRFEFAFAPGLLEVVATDDEGLESETEHLEVFNLPPEIIEFTVIDESTQWRITGTVSDEVAAGLTVVFGGIIGTHQTTVLADGTFDYTWNWASPQTGTATAQVTDPWDLESDVMEAFVDVV